MFENCLPSETGGKNLFKIIVHEFSKLLGKGSKITWNEENEEALMCMKKLLTSTPALSQPVFKNPFYIVTDSSTVLRAGYLGQGPFDEKEVIKYVSRTLESHERKYSITELEYLAVN